MSTTRREFLAAAGVLAVAPVSALESEAQASNRDTFHVMVRYQFLPSRFARDGFLRPGRCMICYNDEQSERLRGLIAAYYDTAEPSAVREFDAEQRDLKRLSEVNECFITVDCYPEELRAYLANNGVVFLWDKPYDGCSETAHDCTDDHLFDETGKRPKRVKWNTPDREGYVAVNGSYQYVHKSRK